MTDRLQEIKAQARPLGSVETPTYQVDVPWLIAEIESLRLVSDVLVSSIVEAAGWEPGECTLVEHIATLKAVSEQRERDASNTLAAENERLRHLAAQVPWLVAELDKMDEKNDRQVGYGQAALDVAAEISALRAVLSQLIDATRLAQYANTEIAAARAAAVSVLKGPET